MSDSNGAAIDVRVFPSRVLKLRLRLTINGAVLSQLTLSPAASRGLAKFLRDQQFTETFLWNFDSQTLYHLRRCGHCVNVVSPDTLLHIPASLTSGLAAILEREYSRIRRLQEFGLL